MTWRHRMLTKPMQRVMLNENAMRLRVEFEQEEDGRWIADVAELPGVMVYGTTPADALAKCQALALRVLADRIEHGEVPERDLEELAVSFTIAA